MKNIKKIIIIALVILLILLVVMLVILKIASGNNNNNIQVSEEDRQDSIIKLEDYTVKEKNDYTFFSVDEAINKLFEYIDEENNQAVYDLTNLEYISQNNIKLSNISSIYTKVNKYYSQEMYKIENQDKAIYYIYGFGVIESPNKLQEIYLKVKIDKINFTYSIEPLKEEEYIKAKNGDIKQIEDKIIAQNANNHYTSDTYSVEKVINIYINDYLFKLKYAPELAFNLLDEEYRDKKFQNINEFKNYIKDNENRFNNFIMQKYTNEIKENYREYIALDTNNNYYKVNVYGTLEYKIILDNYTVETEEYLEEYSNATEESKLTTCIAKFFKLINEKDYESAYNYLDNTFKSNNFGTVEKFQEYVTKNFFNNNILKMKSIEKIGNVYSCKATIKSGIGVAAEEKNLKIIVLLKEGTDFVMSFSIDE